MDNLILINFFICVAYALVIYTLPIVKSQKVRVFLAVSFVHLVFVHTFIDVPLGIDLPVYEETFEEIRQSHQYGRGWFVPWDARMEWGFLALMNIVVMCGGDFRVFLFVCSLLIVTPYYILIKKYSKYVVISVLLFLVTTYGQSLFVLRQHIAVACTLLCYPLIVTRDWRRFGILLVIAYFFHQSAICFIPIYFLYGIKKLRAYIMTLTLGCIGAITLLSAILSYVLGTMFEDYLGYLDSTDEIALNMNSAIIMLLYTVAYICWLRKDSMSFNINKVLLTVAVVGFITAISSVGISSVIGRLNQYFMVIPFLLVPKTMEYIRSIPIRCCYVVGVLVFQCVIVGLSESLSQLELFW